MVTQGLRARHDQKQTNSDLATEWKKNEERWQSCWKIIQGVSDWKWTINPLNQKLTK